MQCFYLLCVRIFKLNDTYFFDFKGQSFIPATHGNQLPLSGSSQFHWYILWTSSFPPAPQLILKVSKCISDFSRYKSNSLDKLKSHIFRHNSSQIGLLLADVICVGFFSHLRSKTRICWNKKRISSSSLTSKSWNTRVLFQVKKGTGKKACDNKENRLSHRILNPFWMTMLTGAIWIQCTEPVWSLRQTRPAEHFMRDLWKKYRCGCKLRWETVKCLSLWRGRMCWWLLSLKRFGLGEADKNRGSRWGCTVMHPLWDKGQAEHGPSWDAGEQDNLNFSAWA